MKYITETGCNCLNVSWLGSLLCAQHFLPLNGEMSVAAFYGSIPGLRGWSRSFEFIVKRLRGIKGFCLH